MALPKLLDHHFLVLTAQLSAALSVPPVSAPGGRPSALADQWLAALAAGAQPQAPIGVEVPLATPPGATTHLPLSALEVMLACWADEHLAWGLEQLGYPALGEVSFPGLAAAMATNLATVSPASAAPAIVKALAVWRGRGNGAAAVVDAIRSPMDLWEVASHRIHRSAGPSHAQEELPPAQALLAALQRCGLDWSSPSAPEAVCASVAKAWECYPSLPIMPGFQRALLQAAPGSWWSRAPQGFTKLPVRGQTLLEQVAVCFPAGPCRQAAQELLSRRAQALPKP